MRVNATIGGELLDFEAPEAPRYKAAMLVLPGLFQSFEQWRPLTSALAHRGWEIYFLPRGLPPGPSRDMSRDLPQNLSQHPSLDLPQNLSQHPSPDLPQNLSRHPSPDLPQNPSRHPSPDLPQNLSRHPSPDLPQNLSRHPSPDLPQNPSRHPSPDLPQDSAPSLHGSGSEVPEPGRDAGWQDQIDRASRVIDALEDQVVILASDLGAAMTLSLPSEGQKKIIAMALLSPCSPSQLPTPQGRKRSSLLASLGRILGFGSAQPRTSHTMHTARTADTLRTLHPDLDAGASTEAAQLIEDLEDGIDFEPPTASSPGPPTLIFTAHGNSRVETAHTKSFAEGSAVRLARVEIESGPELFSNSQSIADEIQRFLVLALGDKIVEFPDEIFED